MNINCQVFILIPQVSSQYVQSRTDLKRGKILNIFVLGREFHNEDGTSYQEI